MAFDFPSGPTELQLYAPTGGPTYKYVAPGWRVVDSGTASFDPDSKAIFNAFTTAPTESRKDLIDRCVKALKAGGVWDKLDALYAFAAADSQAARVNWKNPGTFNATLVNAPAFAADSGFTGNGTTNYLDSSFNPTTAPSPKFTQNSASIFGWSNTNVAFNSPMLGSTGAASSNTVIYPRYGTGNYYARVNTLANMTAASADSLGFWNVVRSGASAGQLYKNTTTLVPSDTGASTAMHNAPMLFLASPPEFWLGQLAAGGFGSALTAADNTALYNALKAYMDGSAADRIIASFTTPPTEARKTLIRNCVTALQSAGIWDKLDCMYMLAAADSQASKINWKAPGAFTLTEVTTPTFTVDQGWHAPSGMRYLDSGWIPGVHGVNFLQNNASAHIWNNSAARADAQGSIGLSEASAGSITINPWNNGADNAQIALNSGAANAANVGGPALSMFTLTRSDNLNTTLYRDGNNVGTAALGTVVRASTTAMRILSGGGLASTRQIAMGAWGGHFTAAEAVAFHNAIAVYMAGLAVEKIVAAFTTPPSAARKTLITNCVNALVAAGVWDKLDTLYAFAAADSQAAKVNWRNPGTFNCTEINSPTFVADQGFEGGPSKYLNSGFNPTTAIAPKYVRDSAAFFTWSLKAAGDAGSTIGYTLSNPDIQMFGRYTDNQNYVHINDNNSVGVGVADGSGLFAASRTGASAVTVYRNGASIISNTSASLAPPNQVIGFFQRAGANYFTGQLAVGGFGSQLSAADNTALYNALNTYLTNLVIYQAETDAIAAAFTTPPTTARKNLIDAAVVSLKSAGVWTKLDALYLFAAADSQAAKINWKAPGTYNATEVNAPVFAVDTGFSNTGSKRLDIAFNPTTAPSPKFTLNDASLFVWSNSSGLLGGGAIGNGQNHVSVYPRYADGNFIASLNTGSFLTVATADGSGLSAISRTSASNVSLYKNGASVSSPASASTSLQNVGMYFFVGQSNEYRGQLAGGGWGSQLSAAEQLALYNALAAYRAGAAADRIIGSFTTPPTAARAAAIRTCVTSLMQGNVWDKLDALYLFAAADSQAAKINWVNPGTYNCTEVNAPVFTADQGFTGASTKYVDSNFNPTTATTPKFTQSDASAFAWSLTAGSIVGGILSAQTNVFKFYPNSGGNYIANIHNSAADNTAATADGSGMLSASRTSVTGITSYKNGANPVTRSDTSFALQNQKFLFLVGISSQSYTGQCAGGGWGSQLSGAEQLALYNALRTYLTGVGVP